MTSTVPSAPARPDRTAPVAAAGALDAALVVVFVLVGRRSHGEAGDLAGAASTAWPFLLALLAGWLVARAWRAPASRRTGLVVWLVTVALGQGLRGVAGQGSAVSFVVVTAVVLGLFLLGWRGLAALAQRRRSAR
jgi:Protein of unknown function (DUF3054)